MRTIWVTIALVAAHPGGVAAQITNTAGKSVAVSSLPSSSDAHPNLIFGQGRDMPTWVLLFSDARCPPGVSVDRDYLVSRGAAWSDRKGPLAIFCGGRRVGYVSDVPYAEFRARVREGNVLHGQAVQGDYDANLPLYAGSNDDLDTVYDELGGRASAQRTAGNAPPLKPASRIPASPGGPSEADILSAHARTNARYYSGSLTSVVGQVAYPSPYGGIAYYQDRSIDGLRCRRAAPAGFTCSYDVVVRVTPAPDSLYGKLKTSFMPPTSRSSWTYDYVRQNGVWYSAALDAYVRNAVIASNAAEEKGRAEDEELNAKRREEERQRKFQQCMQEVRYVPCAY